MSGRRWTLVLVVAVLVVGTGAWILVRFIGDRTGPECVVQAGADAPENTVALADSTTSPGLTGADALGLDAIPLQYASTINAVGLRRELPDRARVIALATALQESSLRNVTTGDRDSVGLFQQRPSQGWGTPAQLIDPVYAAGAFYDALLDVPDWATLPLTEAAQAVQQSGHPAAYAKWEPAAAVLSAALSDLRYGVVSCRAGAQPPTTAAPDRTVVPGAESTVPALRDLLSAAHAELGDLTVDSVGDNGRTATVTPTVAGLDPDRAAAVVASWTVAHATGSGVTAVAISTWKWSDHSWSTVADASLPGRQLSITVTG